MKLIDLNVDIGEDFPWDRELLGVASSANICVGGYAGSTELCLEITRWARARGVAVGAHVGYADRAGFGRRALSELDSEAAISMSSLLLQAMPDMKPDYLKPHGAFYNESATGWTMPLLRALMAVVNLPLLGLPGSAHATGDWQFISEGFADRAYRPDGTLIPRSEPGAVLTDTAEVCEQAVRLAERVESICLHGDEPGCVDRAHRVREALEGAGYKIHRVV